ncbi:DUF2878 domain-containing protein [Grimontia marina]|uniref:DUF2878 domain-containing protein n=1 Tax=Grimontia marina TaxID=646534 RepID=A0A128FCY8_9GAMM|nr:DUF2878 domain-containing protein [Grimontia marina]CZF84204.1 hypothetical protein GMA8713_02991 [Grimontia marina]
MRIVLISLTFNAFWFAAVLGQNSMLPFLVLALIGAVLLDRGVLFAVPLFTLIGIAGDTVLIHLQILKFETSFMPLWLGFLWAGFGTYIWLVRDWLITKPFWLLVATGAVGGAGSYLGGARLGAVEFSMSPTSTALVLAAAWFIYSTVFLVILKRLSRKGEACIKPHLSMTEKSLAEKD